MYIFISAERPDVPATVNADNHRNLGWILRERYGRDRVDQVEGAYDGVREMSWRVRTDVVMDIPKLMHLAFLYRQESILVQTGYDAVLWFTDAADLVALSQGLGSPTQELGRLVEIPEELVDDAAGWSKIDGRYFAVKSS